MPDWYVFSDEAGNFDFSSKVSASRYFVLCTVTAEHCGVGDALLRILEKRKAQLHLQNEHSFYKMAWYLHFKYVAPRIAHRSDRLFVAAASLGTKKKRGAFHTAVDDVVRQVSPCRSHRVAFWPASSDPCLQVADYCTWAIQRAWERGDDRSRALIESKISSEFDVWKPGSAYFY
jgi:hypothetical protein